MANKKYKLTDGNMWATDGIHDFGQNKTQRTINSEVNSALGGKAPTNHASTATTYGAASTSNYGHVKLSNTTPSMDGTAAVGDSTDVARANHVHPSDTSRVPTSRKVNNKQLSSDITLSAADVSAVPTSRKVNDKQLSADITLSASDVGAAPTSHASTATTYGKGTSSNYGHVKISDSLTDTTPAATGGVVPSMKAVSDLNGAINSLSSDDIANDSTKISGATVTDALDALRDNIKTNTAWKNVSASYGTLQAYYYESGTAAATYDLPENYVYVLTLQYKSNRGTAIAIRWQSGEYKVWVNKLHDTWEGWKQINGSTTIGKFTLTANCWEVWGPADADVATYSVTETGFYEVWFAPVLNVSNTNARIRLWLGSTLVAEQQCGFNSGEVRLPAAISYKGNINAGTTIYLSYQSDQGASAVRLLFGDNNYVRKIG